MSTPLSPHTLVYGFESPGDPQVSPDGTRIVYSLVKTDDTTQRISSQLWLCDRDGANPRLLTSNGNRNGSARWAPDGSSLAFVSDRVERCGIFVLPMVGGEAREVTRYHVAINDLAWSPDGTCIAFTAAYDPAAPQGEKPAAGAAPRVRATTRIDYKQDTRGYLGDARNQVFVVDVATTERRMVTCEPVDHGQPAWSPDGTQLAVRISTQNGMVSRLALVPSGGPGSTEYVSVEGGVVSTWAWSADGRRMVFTGDTWQSSQNRLLCLRPGDREHAESHARPPVPAGRRLPAGGAALTARVA